MILDSLKQELARVKNDTQRVLIYEKMAHMAPSRRTRVEYGQQGLALAKRIRYDRGAILCGIALGSNLIQVDYYRAISILHETRQLCEKQNNQYELAKALAYLGYAYNYYDHQTGMAYYKRCEKLMKKIGMSEDVMPISLGIGTAYKDWGKPDSALVYLLKVYKAALRKKSSPSTLYIHLGEVYYDKGEKTIAEDYFRRSLAAKLSEGHHSQSYLGLARIYRDRNQLDSARVYAKKSLQMEQAQNRTNYIKKSADLLFQLYKTSNAAEALKYHLISSTINDSLYSQERARQIERFAFEEREHEAQIRRRLEASKISYENKIKLYGLSGVLGSVLLLAFFLYRDNQQKQKHNTLLQQKNEKIEKTIAELKATQAQLIQKEKMASLGELTAGIAHEIQNPLNFVNNFSEVSTELVEELKEEIKADRTDDALAIAEDLSQNLQKISQHGTRASSIVKGMLEHSRTSTGQRQPTDLNALCEEYLRLAYHSLRAKDKEFNADLKTNLDPHLGKANVVPQEIGRVLLNLFNNAFYAVQLRQNEGPPDFRPTVTVSTKAVGDGVEINISDNGPGIPDAIRNKIFQPFFTTKPTGEGTGLGLSLSYDIITKGHSGSLSLETSIGQGTTFTIQLPNGF